jgi:hypothetical protein
VDSFSADFSLPFFDFGFVFEPAAAAALGFSRVTPGANASRGASSGTTKNALISNLGDTAVDAEGDGSGSAAGGTAIACSSGSPVGGLEELLLGVSSGRETDEQDVGGKDGEGDSSGSILM